MERQTLSQGAFLLHRAVAALVAGTLAFFRFASHAHAANKYWIGTTSTAGAAVSDRWEVNANWSTVPRGTPNTTAPTSSDVAIFTVSGTTVRIRSSVSIGGLVMTNVWTGSVLQGTGVLKVGSTGIRIGSGTLVGGYGVGANRLDTTGSFTQTGGIVKNVIGNFSLSGSLSIMSVSNSRPSFTLTGTLIFTGGATQYVTIGQNRVTSSIKNVTLNNSGSAGSNRIHSSGSGVTVSGVFTINTGVLDMTRTSTAQALTVGGGMTIADSSSAGFQSANAITLSGGLTIGASASWTTTGGTLTLNGDNPQTVTLDDSSHGFNNLTINNTGGSNTQNKVTFAGNAFTVAGNLTVTQGSLDLSTNGIPMTVSGNVSVANSSLARLLSNASIAAAGNITVYPSATFTMSNGNTVTLNGSAQTLSGSMTFQKLTKSVTSADTLTFSAGDTFSAATLTLAGKAGALLTVKSAVSGSTWYISPTKATANYLAVSDSSNTALETIFCYDCTDGGRNSRWEFRTTPASSGGSSSGGGGGGHGGGGGGGRTYSVPAKTQEPAMVKVKAKVKTSVQQRLDVRKAKLNQPMPPKPASPAKKRVKIAPVKGPGKTNSNGR